MEALLLFIPGLTAIACLASPSPDWKHRLNAIGASFLMVVAFLVAAEVFMLGPRTGWRGNMYVDGLSTLMILIIGFIGLSASLYSTGYMEKEREEGVIDEKKLGRYYLWFHLFLMTMMASCIANNLGVLWVAIEATTLVSALLVGFYRKEASLEAAWKYIILCSVGIAFALFGLILLYFASVNSGIQLSQALNWSELMLVADRLDPELVKLSFIFVIIGFGTKAGFAPMHNWLPDAHSQAPSPVSALLSGVLLNCALVGVLRFHVLATQALQDNFSSQLLLGFGLISMVVAVPFVLLQHDVKRLLAYSSVEHIGLIAAAVGIGGPVALFGAVWHMVNHALAKSSMFFLAGNLTQQFHTRKIARIHGCLKHSPMLGGALIAGILALGGAPPFGVFMSEMTVVASGLGSSQPWLGFAILVPILLVFAGIVYHTGQMVLGETTGRRHRENHKESLATVWVPLLPLSVVLILGVYLPDSLQQMLMSAVEVLRGGQR